MGEGVPIASGGDASIGALTTQEGGGTSVGGDAPVKSIQGARKLASKPTRLLCGILQGKEVHAPRHTHADLLVLVGLLRDFPCGLSLCEKHDVLAEFLRTCIRAEPQV